MTTVQKTALITGITGQDGAYLAELLLRKVTLFTVLSAAVRASIRAGWIIFMRIPTLVKEISFSITGISQTPPT